MPWYARRVASALLGGGHEHAEGLSTCTDKQNSPKLVLEPVHEDMHGADAGETPSHVQVSNDSKAGEASTPHTREPSGTTTERLGGSARPSVPERGPLVWRGADPGPAAGPQRGGSHYRQLPSWNPDRRELPRRASTADPQGPLERLASGRRRFLRCSCGVIDPNHSSWLYKWDIVHSIQLVATSLLWPYETAFLEPQFDTIFVVNHLCDMILVIDMLMQCFIAYPDPLRPERSVKTQQAILMNYIKGWFFADFISVLPVDFVYLKVKQKRQGEESYLWQLRALQYIRVVRLIRLVRFVKLIERWNTFFGMSHARITLLKLLSTLVLCCHWLACLWGGLITTLKEETNWLDAVRAAKGGPDFPRSDYHFHLYTLSLYWAIVTITSIGYGDISPQSMAEYHVATVCAAIMAAIWAYVIGAICGIVATMDQHEVFFKRTIDDLNWFMEDQSMPPMMRQRLRRYFHEAKEMSKQKVEQTVIRQLSPLLQGEVSMFMHSKWISKVWYLRDMNRQIIVWAARNLGLAVFAPNEEVLDDRTLFIVQRGLCAHNGKILMSGDIWGEDMLLSNPCLRDTGKARAMSHLAVLTLHIADLFEVVVCFSEARARLRWAQIQIATCRGVLRLAKSIKALKARDGFDPWALTDEERGDLYRRILQGGDQRDFHQFAGDVDMGGQSSDGLPRRNSLTSSATILYRANVSGTSGFADNGPSRGGSEGADVPEMLKQLQASMQEIQSHLRLTSSTSHRSDHPLLKDRSRSWALQRLDLGPPPKVETLRTVTKRLPVWMPQLI